MYFDSKAYFGGVRKRVFKNNDDPDYCCNLTKISLFKYIREIFNFSGKTKEDLFYGRVNNSGKHKNGLLAYSIYDEKIYQFKLSLSKI